jgi:cytoskeletal protein CcmA (bactofilin family)
MAWIKQKDNDSPRPAESARQSAPQQPQRSQQPQQPQNQQRERRVTDHQVNIGKSVQIKGDLTGQEDLTIEGKLEGKVMLGNHQLTIGANGRIQGEIRARTVVVVGELIGNISADDKVEVASSGSMRGNIRAPRVVLADGADFRGSVDMDSRKGAKQESAKAGEQAPVEKTANSQIDSKPAAMAGASK